MGLSESDWGQFSRKGPTGNVFFTDRKCQKIGESEITGVEEDKKTSPQIFIEEDDDLYEQYVVDE